MNENNEAPITKPSQPPTFAVKRRQQKYSFKRNCQDCRPDINYLNQLTHKICKL